MVNMFMSMTEKEKIKKETWDKMNKKHLLQNEKVSKMSISDRLKEIGVSEKDNPFAINNRRKG